MSKKQKYYVVWSGRNPGIYTNWGQVLSQIEGFKGSKYKKYDSRTEAEYAFENLNPIKTDDELKKAIPQSISVDASSMGNPGLMEYRGVITSSGQEIFRVGPLDDGTNNIGEFLALVHGLALLQSKGDQVTSIFTDSATAMSWVRNKKAKTTLDRTGNNDAIFELIARAEKWLQSHTYKNEILKWPTERWGEIPADFGRK